MDVNDPNAGSLADKVFQLLSEQIVDGSLPPGSKLSEPLLSRRLGVSRGTLREAIRRLEERHLVSRSPRLGARVVDIAGPLFVEIATIREALEGISAREAALKITPTQIDELKRILDLHEALLAREPGADYARLGADTDFHFAIARFSGNTSLFNLLCGEYYQLIRLFRSRHSILPGRAQRALVEHHRIADALFDRDPELAEIQMRRHVSAAKAAAAATLQIKDRK